MKLLDQVRDVLRKRHYSIRTEQARLDWIKQHIFFNGKRHPWKWARIETLVQGGNLKLGVNDGRT